MSFARLTLTQSATLLGLTPAMVGFALARGLGLHTAIASMLLACAITSVLAALSSLLAVTYRAPTAPLSGVLLGPWGPKLVGAALALSAAGFFGVHLMALLQALPALFPDAPQAWPRLPVVLACAVGSLALVWRGNAHIAGINGVQAPLLVAAIGWAAYAAWHRAPPQAWSEQLAAGNGWHWHGPSVAMVVAAGLGDVVDLPSVMHKARSRAAAIGAALVTYGVVLPTLLLAGALLSQDVAAPSALGALADGNAPWRLGVCLLAMSCATVGNANLVYSGGLSVAAAAGRACAPIHRVALTVAAAGLSLTPLATRLGPLLDTLGLMTGAVGTGLLVNFVLDGGRAQRRVAPRRARLSAAACALGAMAGVATLWAASAQGAGAGWSVAGSCGCAALATLLGRVATRRDPVS